MKRLTVFTERYEKTLQDFIQGTEHLPLTQVKNTGREDGLFFVRLAYEPTDDFITALLAVLEEVAMAQNPVYNGAPKLKDTARVVLGVPARNNNAENLRRFLFENNKIHLEGYAAFRMADFTYALDLMTYGLIKKLSNP